MGMVFDTVAMGIPCKVEIDSYDEYIPPSFDSPAEGGEIYYTILDRKGYPAKWLESRLSSAEWEELEERVAELLSEEVKTNKLEAELSKRDMW